jgi:hypothetical protein
MNNYIDVYQEDLYSEEDVVYITESSASQYDPSKEV